MARYSHNRFTLIEVMVSLAILCVVVSGTIRAMAQIQHSSVMHFDRIYARQILNEVSAKYEYIDYDKLFSMARNGWGNQFTNLAEYVGKSNGVAGDTSRMKFQDDANAAGQKNFTPHIDNADFYTVNVSLTLNKDASEAANHAIKVVVSVQWDGIRGDRVATGYAAPEVSRTFYRLED